MTRPESERLDIMSAVPETVAATAALGVNDRPGTAGLSHDIERILRVVVQDGGEGDHEVVSRDVGLARDAGGSTMPILRIRFVDELAANELRVLDGGALGYSEDGVYALSRGRTPLACMTQRSRWGAGAIDCRRRVAGVPFLTGAIDLAAIAAGWAPLHASAWTTPEGIGVLASVFAHSAKTGALLAACQNGARPVGDDRILLSGDGRVMLGLGRPVEAKDWHIAQLGLARGVVGGMRRALARSTSALAPRVVGKRDSGWSRLLEGARNRARRLSSTRVDLSVFGAEGHPRARPHLLLLMETHDSDRIVAEKADPDSVPRRLAAHVGAELAPALRTQLAYQYVRGGWADVDGAPRVALRILEKAVRNIPAWIVRHPYPCSLERLRAVTSQLAEAFGCR